MANLEFSYVQVLLPLANGSSRCKLAQYPLTFCTPRLISNANVSVPYMKQGMSQVQVVLLNSVDSPKEA